MTFKKAKLFWKKENDEYHIRSIPYDDTLNYYAFLQTYKEKGYKQIIITSEIMIQVIRESCLGKNHFVQKIELENNPALEKEIQDVIQLTTKNLAYFCDLIEKIKSASQQSSLILKKTYMQRIHNGTYEPAFFLQSNGILGINTIIYDSVAKEISTMIEKHLTAR